jgi:uncharacterized protein DUF3311
MMSDDNTVNSATGDGTLSRSGGPPAATARWLLIGVILAIPIVLPLLVSTYARTSPKLGGVPFYFWWQFFLIIVSGVLTIVAYVLVLRFEAERRGRKPGAEALDDQSLGDETNGRGDRS